MYGVCVCNGNFTSIHSKNKEKCTYINCNSVCYYSVTILYVMLIRFRNDWTWMSTLIVLLTWYFTTKKIILFLDLWMLFQENQKSSQKHKILTRTIKSTIFRRDCACVNERWFEAWMMTSTYIMHSNLNNS